MTRSDPSRGQTRGPRSSRDPRPPSAAAPAAARGDRRGDDRAVAIQSLRRIVRELRVAAAHAQEETGLRPAQLFVLQQVADAPGLSLTEIAARTMTDRTSVGAVVERLLARSLVERRPGAVDRRRAEIFATRQGARVLARAPHPPTRRVVDAIASMSDRDLRQLARGLDRLVSAMGLAGEPAPMLFEDARPARDRRGASRRRATAAPAPRAGRRSSDRADG